MISRRLHGLAAAAAHARLRAAEATQLPRQVLRVAEDPPHARELLAPLGGFHVDRQVARHRAVHQEGQVLRVHLLSIHSRERSLLTFNSSLFNLYNLYKLTFRA